MRQVIYIFVFILLAVPSVAQTPGNLEKIIGIVGDRIILNSDVETAYLDAKKQDPTLSEDTKCDILEQTLGQKILAEQADRDSVVIADEELEGFLENRIRSFVNHYGSEQKLEEVAGKSVYQLKDEYRPVFREQLKAQRMQQQLMSTVKITPEEVRAFYKDIPQDSLPFYPSTVEIGQILIAPDINPEVDKLAREKLEGIRKDIVKGVYTFDMSAGIHSEDPGSRNKGGDMGFVSKDELVPEFAGPAFRLQVGEISKVVKSPFGYHIIEMIERRGEMAHLRHILVKPLVTTDVIEDAMVKADSVRSMLIAGKITFGQAVKEYSADKQSKLTGGMITNPYTGSTSLEMDKLDAATTLAIQGLKVGQYATPAEFTDQRGDKMVRIVYLRSRTEPHKANLKDDYYRIQEVALAQKQNKYLYEWLATQIPTFYIKIDKAYHDCPNVKRWVNNSEVKNN